MVPLSTHQQQAYHNASQEMSLALISTWTMGFVLSLSTERIMALRLSLINLGNRHLKATRLAGKNMERMVNPSKMSKVSDCTLLSVLLAINMLLSTLVKLPGCIPRLYLKMDSDPWMLARGCQKNWNVTFWNSHDYEGESAQEYLSLHLDEGRQKSQVETPG